MPTKIRRHFLKVPRASLPALHRRARCPLTKLGNIDVNPRMLDKLILFVQRHIQNPIAVRRIQARDINGFGQAKTALKGLKRKFGAQILFAFDQPPRRASL